MNTITGLRYLVTLMCLVSNCGPQPKLHSTEGGKTTAGQAELVLTWEQVDSSGSWTIASYELSLQGSDAVALTIDSKDNRLIHKEKMFTYSLSPEFISKVTSQNCYTITAITDNLVKSDPSAPICIPPK
jgi:hypothetical protein